MTRCMALRNAQVSLTVPAKSVAAPFIRCVHDVRIGNDVTHPSLDHEPLRLSASIQTRNEHSSCMHDIGDPFLRRPWIGSMVDDDTLLSKLSVVASRLPFSGGDTGVIASFLTVLAATCTNMARATASSLALPTSTTSPTTRGLFHCAQRELARTLPRMADPRNSRLHV
jgi:hypothetical protein